MTAQGSSIGTTVLYTTGSNPAGLYRISYYLVTTTAGTAGDTATVTISWRDDKQSQSQAGSAVSLSTNGAFQAGNIVIQSASGTDIDYGVSVSAVVGSPKYSFYATAERLQ